MSGGHDQLKDAQMYPLIEESYLGLQLAAQLVL